LKQIFFIKNKAKIIRYYVKTSVNYLFEKDN
jgi:hypothetical protein